MHGTRTTDVLKTKSFNFGSIYIQSERNGYILSIKAGQTKGIKKLDHENEYKVT
jgi:hypothetical protein